MTDKPDTADLNLLIKEHEDKILKLTEENACLNAENLRYRELFDNTPASITLATLDGRLLAANRSMSEMTGYSMEELMEMDIEDLYENPIDRKTIIKTLREEGALINTPMRLKRKNGAIYNALLTFTKLQQQPNEDIYQCICLDISKMDRIDSERKMLQTRLEESRKLDGIAVLAGGIAHKFNNALAAVIGNIELLEINAADAAVYSTYIKPIKETAYQMAELTEQLLAYARTTDYKPKAISPVEFIEDTLPLVKHTIKPGIKLHTNLDEKTWNFKADLSQLQMVFSAIISNSSEAIQNEGNIWITCRNTILADDDLNAFPDIVPGEYIEMLIDDDGKGMDAGTRNKIFEPFFTTKFYGHGLGMAAVYGIIKKHGGAISVEAREGRGTRVRILFTALEKITKHPIAGKSGMLKGTGNVLLIEDEAIVMDVNQAILEKLGYSVIKAENGKEAIEKASTFPDKIDLVILDVLLPDMGGDEVYHRLKEIIPDARIIVCSGYSSDGPAQKIIDAGAQGFIQKPFSFKKLAEKIKEVLSF